MDVEVRFHRLASRDFLEARDWYESRRPGLGRRFRDEVDRAVLRIAAEPDRWPRFRERFRRIRVRRFPFALYYRPIDGDRVLVLAVAHDRRRPGYWHRRSSQP